MSRKLHSEIEKVQKKIAEGVIEFNNTLEKVRNANTNNQKEKYESDLKKEIKKLQRHRDQLKSWITDKEVKDKKPLIDARKLIEEHMEKFRECERKTKTKAYSKEGLQMMTEQEDEKAAGRKWFAETTAALSEQINTIESELGKAAANGDMESSVMYEHHLERNQFHIAALEVVLRYWENGDVDDETLRSIEEAIATYLRDNMDPDFFEDEGLYEDLGIDLPKYLLYGGFSQPAPKPDKEKTRKQEKAEAAASAAAASAAAAKAKEEARLAAEQEAELRRRKKEEARQAEAFAKAKASQKSVQSVRGSPPVSRGKSSGPAVVQTKKTPTWVGRNAVTHGADTEEEVLEILQASMQHMPKPLESDKPKQNIPKNPYPMPSYYPSSPVSFDATSMFEKLDTDTLFFIFYYQQGTYQQYLAAAELKSRSWRYHKKYLTWFQRHEEPKEITQDHEQGTYVYFDYETGWCQRKKTEFTFQYRFLEDN